MKIRDIRIQLQKIALDLEEQELSGKNLTDTTAVSDITLNRLENLVRDLIRSAR